MESLQSGLLYIAPSHILTVKALNLVSSLKHGANICTNSWLKILVKTKNNSCVQCIKKEMMEIVQVKGTFYNENLISFSSMQFGACILPTVWHFKIDLKVKVPWFNLIQKCDLTNHILTYILKLVHSSNKISGSAVTVKIIPPLSIHYKS